eukprot:jgi/Hompol1/2628/HPOL_006099-RA
MAIKQVLPDELRTVAVNKIYIHLPGQDKPLRRITPLTEIHRLFGPTVHDDENPLVVKVTPPPLKTIYVQDLDDGIKPLDIFSRHSVTSDKDIDRIVEGKGNFLRPVDQPDVAISRFEQLIEGGRYRIYSKFGIAHVEKTTWFQREDIAMEAEVKLTIRNFLTKISGSGEQVIELPRKFRGMAGVDIQEWDAVFRVGSTLYLCECKHSMTQSKINQIVDRFKGFPALMQHASNGESVTDGIADIVGVACGTDFPDKVVEFAIACGLGVVLPSGFRYEMRL